MDIRKIETFSNVSGRTDSKHINNVANVQVSQSILDKIEAGLTIEELDNIADGLPVFKYKTQITIHGIFPEVGSGYVSGYKSVFQNKNKSIGVRYTAIDESKRQTLRDTLSLFGWSYTKNSSERVFRWFTQAHNSEQIKKAKETIDNMTAGINRDLFYGGVSVYLAEAPIFGTIVVADLYIQSIYEKDIPALLASMNLTPEVVAIRRKELQDRFDKRKREIAAREEAAKKLKDDAYAQAKAELDVLVEKCVEVTSKEVGKYIQVEYNAQRGVFYKVIELRKVGNQRYPRAFTQYFDTVTAALHVLQDDTVKVEGTYGYAVRNPLSGYKLKAVSRKSEKQAENTVDASGLEVVDYSDKAFALFGDTKSIKDKLKELNMRFNFRLKYNGGTAPGWIAPKSRQDEILKELNLG